MRDAFHRSLKAAIDDAIESRSEALSNGSAGTFDQYMRQVGFITGLREVLNLADEVEKKLYGERGED